MDTRVRQPEVSVVIPTYNRAELLCQTLWHLTRQSLPVPEFEVIVSDDGSSDATRDVVRSFSERLRIEYLFQEDLGFRAGTARNAGARAATAPVLCFLDTGAMAGRDFLRNHLLRHRDDSVHSVVIGYAYGYNPEKPMVELRELLVRDGPDAVVASLREDPAFRDVRHDQFARCGLDLNLRAVPWNLLFTINCSVRREEFWAVGGFDEGFRGWGAEDMELGFRLFQRGLSFQLAGEAWVVEWPVVRDFAPLAGELRTNLAYCLRKHPEPVMELGWTLLGPDRPFLDWSDEYAALLRWADRSRGLAVDGEIVEALRGFPADARVAVVGSGAVIPPSAPPVVAVDFDRTLLDQATGGGRHAGHHALGVRTPLAERCVDGVVITSRLSGLWDRWRDDLLAEAHRIGARVTCTFAG